jgi:heat-inducible transcriptional repressor
MALTIFALVGKHRLDFIENSRAFGGFMAGRKVIPDSREGDIPALSARQERVLRAVVGSYVGGGTPVGSSTIAQLLPVNLSAATIRSVMSELSELGLLGKSHASAGRVPTELGLRVFVTQLLSRRDLGDYERRDIADAMEDAHGDAVMRVASDVLSRHTHQLGFAVTPRLERLVLRHASLVRLSTTHVLVVLVAQSGVAHRCLIEDPGLSDQADLDRIASALNDRIAGRTLPEVREALAQEVRALRSQADRFRARALRIAERALAAVPGGPGDLVLGTWLALLDQPEFRDPERLRALHRAIETEERLVALLDEILRKERGPRVAFSDEIGEPALRHCALVVAPYGGTAAPLGVLGVVGPSRMDYARVIPLVDYLSQLVTERLSA